MRSRKKMFPGFKEILGSRPVFIIILSVFLISCGGRSSGDGQVDRRTTLDEMVDTTGTTIYVRENRQDNIDEYEARLERTEERLENLRSRADTVRGDVRVRYNQTLQSLDEQERNAEQMLNDLKQSSAETWDDLQTGFNNTIDELEREIEEAENEFQNNQ
jgi:ABC-type transporter Mla subunit MlaD